MEFRTVIVLVVLGVLGYGLQFLFTSFQLKDFTKTYANLKSKGKVVIGQRSGRFTSGTIVLFALDANGKILDSRILQGISIFARFKQLPNYINEDIYLIDRYHPKVQKENKYTIYAMENAREVYVKTNEEIALEHPKSSAFSKIQAIVHNFKNRGGNR